MSYQVGKTLFVTIPFWLTMLVICIYSVVFDLAKIQDIIVATENVIIMAICNSLYFDYEFKDTEQS